MDTVTMFVNGQALSGGSLNDALAGGDLVGPAWTAPRYRFYSVRDEFPGLRPVDRLGVAVPGEVYRIRYELLREHLLPREPDELELTVVELADGSGSLSMRLRDWALDRPDVVDISSAGGWLTYLANRS